MRNDHSPKYLEESMQQKREIQRNDQVQGSRKVFRRRENRGNCLKEDVLRKILLLWCAWGKDPPSRNLAEDRRLWKEYTCDVQMYGRFTDKIPLEDISQRKDGNIFLYTSNYEKTRYLHIQPFISPRVSLSKAPNHYKIQSYAAKKDDYISS